MSTGRFGRLTDAPASLLLAGIRVVACPGVVRLTVADGRVTHRA